MRILMVCMQFPTGDGDSYLTTELADALVEAGHEVEVLFLDWSARTSDDPELLPNTAGITVVRCTPRQVTGLGSLVGHASKFFLSGRHVAHIARNCFDLGKFDAVIAWMPACAIAPLLHLLERAGIAHRLLFIWDFFPDHHHEIGRIPGGLPFRLARWWERRQIAHFTSILCTLPGNAEYLRRNYPVSADQKVLVTPIWCDPAQRPDVDRRAVRARFGLPTDRPIAVFGGQLTAGRGIDLMLQAADSAGDKPALLFLFVGNGPRAAELRARAAESENVHWLPAMSRDSYLDLLGACDVGLVATVPGVSSFSIPSKTMDYLRSGLPVVAAVEHGNDFAAILERYGVGRSVSFGDPSRFRRTAEMLATDPALQGAAREGARRCLDEIFDVRHAVAAIEEATGAADRHDARTAGPGRRLSPALR